MSVTLGLWLVGIASLAVLLAKWPVYYRVVPKGDYLYRVHVWRCWWPFWVETWDLFSSEEKAAEWIRGHSTYYDGAE